MFHSFAISQVKEKPVLHEAVIEPFTQEELFEHPNYVIRCHVRKERVLDHDGILQGPHPGACIASDVEHLEI